MDELISVGDASFIEKARLRLKGVITNTNILIISSHVEGVVREFCTRVLWLEHGKVMMDGLPDEVLEAYRKNVGSQIFASYRNLRESMSLGSNGWLHV